MVKRSTSTSMAKASSEPNALKVTSLEMNVLALKAQNEELSKALADSKQEVAQLRNAVNCLEKDNFDYHSMTNSLKHVIANFEPLLQSTLTQIMGLSDNFHKLMHLQNIAKHLEVNSPHRDSQSASTSRQIFSPSNTSNRERPHPIKPHMVNGHVLQIPTIKLTRVNEASLSQSIPRDDGGGEANENNRSNVSINNETENRSIRRRTVSRQTRPDLDPMDISDVDLDESLQLNNIDADPSHLDTIQEESETSQYSSRNSTLLSGVFQDVRIYLNQIPQDRVNRICHRKMCIQNNDRSSYVCRPSLSEREQSSLCAEPSTSRISNKRSTPPHQADSDSSDEEENNTVETKIFRASLEKKSFSFTQGTCTTTDNSYNSSNVSATSTASCSSMESKNEDINNSCKLVVMKELGLAPSHLTKNATPLRKLRSRSQNGSTTPKSPPHVTKRNNASSTASKKSSIQSTRSSNEAFIHSKPSTSTPIAEISSSSIELRQINSVTTFRNSPVEDSTPVRNITVKRGSSKSQKSDNNSGGAQVDVVSTTVMCSTSNVTNNSAHENRVTTGDGERRSSQSEQVRTSVTKSSEKTISVQQIVNRVARELGVKRKISSPKYYSPRKMIKRNDGSHSPRKSSEEKSIVQKSVTPPRKSSEEKTVVRKEKTVVRKSISPSKKLGKVSLAVKKSGISPKRVAKVSVAVMKSGTSPKRSSNGKLAVRTSGGTPMKKSNSHKPTTMTNDATPKKKSGTRKSSPEKTPVGKPKSKSIVKKSTNAKKIAKNKVQSSVSPKSTPRTRPVRSARPRQLKEPLLNTKMRR